MLDANDPSVIWVSSTAKNGGDGTRENPFHDIARAVTVVRPGMTIMLMQGIFKGDRTFDISGDVCQPIRIAAEPGSTVEIRAACWFFYDVSDVIVSGLTFREAPLGALSVIGSCARNRFDSLRFVDCGSGESASCSLFFGGSGGSCTVVENCSFERRDTPGPCDGESAAKFIGIMVGEGDTDGGEPITDHVFRKNRFVNYDYGILVGAGDEPAGQYGHIVEYNTVERCREEGILVKCSDTLVRGNRVGKCPNRSISVIAGKGSTVESNRIVDCGRGIQINGSGHTVANNCIIRCAGGAIGVNGAEESQKRRTAADILVECNTCVDCGSAGVRVDAGATAVVRRNLFSGGGRPYVCGDGAMPEKGKRSNMFVENIAARGCEGMKGAAAAAVAFRNAALDDFTNDSGCGASGPVLTPETFDPEVVAEEKANDCRYGHAALDDEGEEPMAESDETPEPAAEDFEGFMGRFYSKNVP
jgi:hypothetical protein